MKASAAAPAAQSSSISFAKLFRWATQALSGIVGPFFLITFLSLMTNLVALYNAQLIANFTGQVQTALQDEDAREAPAPADAGPAPSAESPPPVEPGEKFSFLNTLLPNDYRVTAVLFAVTALLVIALGFANRVGTVWLNTQMLQRLQLRLHDRLIQLGPNYHSRHDMGENSAVIMQYTAAAQPMLRDVLAFPIVRGVSLVTAILLLFYNLNALREEGQDNLIYAVLAVLLIVLPVGGWWLSSRLRGAYAEVRERQSAISNTLVDSLTAPAEIQLMDAGPRRSATFRAKLSDFARAQLQAVIQGETANQFQAAVPTLLQIGLIIWAVFFLGGNAVQAVVGIYLFVPKVVQPIQEIIQFYSGLNTAWPNIEKVGTTLEEPLEVEDKGQKTAAELPSHDLALNDLTFRPLPDLTVLDHVTFSFPRDKITALVGLSGSGKSTILKLVSRLFDPHGGKVTVGGVDIRDLSLSSLRSIIASVSQFPLFIEADVRENFQLAVPNATDQAMEAACRAADIWPTLEKLSPSDPLAAPVPRTAGKAGLSGGERRRLAIARAILADPRILLLDEPVAGVDAISVKKIAEGLRQAAPGRTVLLVEHDMDLIASLADMVCCLEGGRITDVGTPAELAARPSLFKRLLETRRAYGDQAEIEVTDTVPVRRVEVPGGGKEGNGGARRAQAQGTAQPQGGPQLPPGVKPPVGGPRPARPVGG